MKNKKAPTEPITLSDAFNAFDIEYKEFVDWYRDLGDAGCVYCIVKFLENQPVKYTNKWNREQWKILVESEDTEKILSGGKRLFKALKALCIKYNKYPKDLGVIRVDRYGSGFDTHYKMSKNLSQQTLDTPSTQKKDKS